MGGRGQRRCHCHGWPFSLREDSEVVSELPLRGKAGQNYKLECLLEQEMSCSRRSMEERAQTNLVKQRLESHDSHFRRHHQGIILTSR